MVTGSTASTFYGEPRTTHDIDIVLELTDASLDAFLRELPEDDWYVSAEAATDAVARRSMFNVIHLDTGWKVDLIVIKERPYSREEFGRRQQHLLGELSIWVASVEDCILSKLEWCVMCGGSERQLRDVAAMLRVQGASVDRDYIAHWASELGLSDLWRQIGGLAASDS